MDRIALPKLNGKTEISLQRFAIHFDEPTCGRQHARSTNSPADCQKNKRERSFGPSVIDRCSQETVQADGGDCRGRRVAIYEYCFRRSAAELQIPDEAAQAEGDRNHLWFRSGAGADHAKSGRSVQRLLKVR